MKLMFFIPVWGRRSITEICFKGIKRLQKEFDVSAFCVISEPWAAGMAVRYGFDYTETANYPLGRKMITGMQECMKTDFDYLIQINSDDLIHGDLLKLYQPLFESGVDYWGLRDIYFYDYHSTRAKYFCYDDYSITGCGKVLSKSLLEAFEGLLWRPDAHQGMDNHMTEILLKKGIKPQVIYQGDQILSCDIKSGENIWVFDDPLFDDAKEIDGKKIEERFEELCTRDNLIYS